MMLQRATLIAVWLLLMTAALWRLTTATTMISDMSLFLPSASTLTEQLAVEQLRDGPASRLILVGLRGGSAAQRAAISRGMSSALRGQPLFLRVENGSLSQPDQPGQPTWPGGATEPQPVSGTTPTALFDYRYLLGQPGCDTRFSVAQLRGALQARLDELRAPIALPDRHRLPADPTACYRTLLQQWRPAKQPPRHNGLWSSADGRTTLLLIETRAAATELAIQEQAVATIQAAFARQRSALSRGSEPDSDATERPHAETDTKLLLTGPAVFAVRSKQAIQGEISAMSSAAGIAVTLLLLLAFRSPLFLLLGALPLLTGVVGGALAVSLVYGSIHGITLAFGVTLLGVAIDYPIHAFAHAVAATDASGTQQAGLKPGVRRVWPTLLLGLVTTVCGYLALVSPQFPGLTQLALFAASGLIAAALCTRWLLPALAPGLSPHRAAWLSQAPRPAHRPGHRPGHRQHRHRLSSGLLVFAVLVALSPLLTGYAALEDDLAALSPIPASQLALDRELRSALGAAEPATLVVITASDADTALQRAEALRPVLQQWVRQGHISTWESPSQLLPSREVQRQRQAELPQPAAVRQRLQQALQGLAFKPASFEPFLKALEDSRRLPPLTPTALSGSLLGLRLSTLLYPRQRDGGQDWVALLPLHQVHDREALRRAIDGRQAHGVYLLEVSQTSNAIVYRFLQETRAKLLIGGLLMVLILVVTLRNRRRLLAVLLPVALTIAIDLALLSWIEPRLNLFHLIALLLLAGLAVDYSLFFSRSSDGLPSAATDFAVSLCGISTLLMFAILGLSNLPVLHAIGITVAIGVALAYGLALLLSRPWR